MIESVDPGAVRIVALDESGRRFPCPCHAQPTALAFMVDRGGGVVFCATLLVSLLENRAMAWPAIGAVLDSLSQGGAA